MPETMRNKCVQARDVRPGDMIDGHRVAAAAELGNGRVYACADNPFVVLVAALPDAIVWVKRAEVTDTHDDHETDNDPGNRTGWERWTR